MTSTIPVLWQQQSEMTDPDQELPEYQELGKPKNGIDYNLEDYADELLAQNRRENPRSQDQDPYEVLSPGQLDRRRSREIYNRNGFPEAHLFSGIYRRAHNPLLNKRSQVMETFDQNDASGERNG